MGIKEKPERGRVGPRAFRFAMLFGRAEDLLHYFSTMRVLVPPTRIAVIWPLDDSYVVSANFLSAVSVVTGTSATTVRPSLKTTFSPLTSNLYSPGFNWIVPALIGEVTVKPAPKAFSASMLRQKIALKNFFIFI